MPSPAGQHRLAQQEPCKRTIAFRALLAGPAKSALS
jgi:hypothetical protein